MSEGGAMTRDGFSFSCFRIEVFKKYLPMQKEYNGIFWN
jgi:hypothetical protein